MLSRHKTNIVEWANKILIIVSVAYSATNNKIRIYNPWNKKKSMGLTPNLNNTITTLDKTLTKFRN